MVAWFIPRYTHKYAHTDKISYATNGFDNEILNYDYDASILVSMETLTSNLQSNPLKPPLIHSVQFLYCWFSPAHTLTMLFLLLLPALPRLAVTEYCFPQYCSNYDGTVVWCDQSRNLCMPGTWYDNYATCLYVGEDGVNSWESGVWCEEHETCETDGWSGSPYCADWGAAVEAGLSILYIVIICVVVGVVVVILACCCCCYWVGRGCCKRGRSQQQGGVVVRNAVHPGSVPAAGNSPGNMPTSTAPEQLSYHLQQSVSQQPLPQYPPHSQYPQQYPAQYPAQYPQQYPAQFPVPSQLTYTAPKPTS